MEPIHFLTDAGQLSCGREVLDETGNFRNGTKTHDEVTCLDCVINMPRRVSADGGFIIPKQLQGAVSAMLNQAASPDSPVIVDAKN